MANQKDSKHQHNIICTMTPLQEFNFIRQNAVGQTFKEETLQLEVKRKKGAM
jgi:hypothetical protein